MAESAGQGGRARVKPPVAPVAEVVRPDFKLILWLVTFFTILSLVICVVVAFWGDPTKDMTKSLYETCSTTYKMGFGAIIGLVGGKSL